LLLLPAAEGQLELACALEEIRPAPLVASLRESVRSGVVVALEPFPLSFEFQGP